MLGCLKMCWTVIYDGLWHSNNHRNFRNELENTPSFQCTHYGGFHETMAPGF